jgi:hypothetical protein
MTSINIYIDSNITYSDPLFQTAQARALFDIAEYCDIYIFMSDVVIKETRNNYLKAVNEEVEKYDKAARKLNAYGYKLAFPTIDQEQAEKIWCHRYRCLYKECLIFMIKHKKSFISEMIDRDIAGRKPFKKSGVGFRDCLLWLSYANHANSSPHQSFFITKNVKDFCDDNGELHPDLKKDTRNIKVYGSFGAFMQGESCLLLSAQNNAEIEYFFEQDIPSLVSTIFSNEESVSINDGFKSYIKSFDIFYLAQPYLETGYNGVYKSFNITDNKIENANIYGKQIVVSGKCSVSLAIEFISIFPQNIRDDLNLPEKETCDYEGEFSYELWTDKDRLWHLVESTFSDFVIYI